MELAATRIITKKKGVWFVPSQFGGKEKYQVNLASETPSCTCLDHETRGVKCKHIYAATFVMKREQNADGSTTVTESVTFTATKQTTYPQNWAVYNDAQTHEQDSFNRFSPISAPACPLLSQRTDDRRFRCRTLFLASCSKSTRPSRSAALSAT